MLEFFANVLSKVNQRKICVFMKAKALIGACFNYNFENLQILYSSELR